jgi:hypothetical protein
MSKETFPCKIVKAIRSDDDAYFCIDGPSGHLWCSAAELVEGGRELYRRINSRTGATIISQSRFNNLRTMAENYGTFEEGRVAASSGWCGDSFVFGDGDVSSPEGADIDVVTMQPLDKFTPQGNLRKWQKRMAPFISGQPLPFFVCALALCGPLYRFLDASVGVVQVELAGEAGSGKSTLGALAASVWAGNPQRTEGGGENWNMTLNAYDTVRFSHRDTFLLLDEAEGSGQMPRVRAEFAKAVVFKGSQSQGKKRLTDTAGSPDVRIPVLSTSNTPLHQVLRQANEQTRDAAMQRMMSLRVSRLPSNDGVMAFQTLPQGHEKAAEAVRDLRSAVDEVYGAPGRAFVRKLVRLAASDEAGLRKRLRLGIKSARDRLSRIDATGEDRHRSMLAAVEVTATLAQEFGILQPGWGTPATVVDFIYRECTASTKRQGQTAEIAYRRFVEYLCQEITIGKIGPRKPQNGQPPLYPITISRNDQCGVAYLLPEYFKATFPGAPDFLAEMKKSGSLRLHGSEKGDRLQFHPPAKIKRCGFNRVYAIELDEHAIAAVLKVWRECNNS